MRYVEVRDLSEIDRTFAGLSKDRSGVVVPPQPFFGSNRRDIAHLAARHRLAAIYGVRSFVEDGGFMSYGLSLPRLWHQAARYVDKISRARSPATSPSSSPRSSSWPSTSTHKALGLTIPPSLLQRPDQVIE